MFYTSNYASPIGDITLASDGQSVTGVWFLRQKYYAGNLPENHGQKELPVFTLTKKWLDVYFSGREPDFTLPISLSGISPFRRRVWEIMLTIPYGKTMTYGEIARQIERETGKRASAQAVGGAVGHNSVGIIIPCHRVMGAGGNITGYAGGIDKKIALLKLEGVDTNGFTLSKKSTAR